MAERDLHLAIDFGDTCTVGVLDGMAGQPPVVLSGGPGAGSSVVYVETDGRLVVGPAALDAATRRPQRLIRAPKRHLAANTAIEVDGRAVDPVEVAAAVLGSIAGQARTTAGQWPTAVTLTAPASWGPRRRGLLRQAADRAGLPPPELVDTPVAIARHLERTNPALPPDTYLMVIDLGAGCEVSVLRRDPQTWAVLAVRDLPDAGGTTLDTAIAAHQHLHPAHIYPTPADPPARRQPVGQTRAGALVRSVAVSDKDAVGGAAASPPSGAGRFAELDQARVDAVFGPVLQPVAVAARDALAACDLPAGTPVTVVCAGGAARIALVVDVLSEQLDIPVYVIGEPHLAAAYGALPAIPVDPGVERPASGDLPAVLVPAGAALAMLVYFLTSARIFPASTTGDQGRIFANWGLWATTNTTITLAILAAATLLPAIATSPTSAGPAPMHQQLARALPTGALVAVATSTALALAAAVFYNLNQAPWLRWAVLPALPIAGAAAMVGVLARRGPAPPGGSWLNWLRYPPSAVTLGAVGTLLIHAGTSGVPAIPIPYDLYCVHVGGAILGASLALTLAATPLYRLILGAPLALAGLAIADPRTTGILAVAYTITVTAWWLHRAATLLTHHQPAANPPTRVRSQSPSGHPASQCPGCGGLLDNRRPSTCPVCRQPTDDRGVSAGSHPARTGTAGLTARPDGLAPRPAPVPARPETDRRLGKIRTRLIIGAVAVGGAVAIVIGAVPIIEARLYPADRPVLDLFTALTNRDVARIQELGGCPATSPLCTAHALDHGYQPPEHPTILGIHYSDERWRPDHATVDVGYQLAGTSHTETVGLHRDRSLLRRWQIVDPPGHRITLINPQLDTVRLADTTTRTIPTGDLLRQPYTDPPTDLAFWALPGIYTLTTPDNPLFATTTATITITGQGALQPITIALTINPTAVTEIDRQVHQQLDTCAAQASFAPDVDPANVHIRCPFSYDTRRVITRDPTWTITAYPTITLQLATTGAVTIHTNHPGQATITYQWTEQILEPRTWNDEHAQTDITIAGTAAIEHGTIRWIQG